MLEVVERVQELKSLLIFYLEFDRTMENIRPHIPMVPMIVVLNAILGASGSSRYRPSVVRTDSTAKQQTDVRFTQRSSPLTLHPKTPNPKP